MTHHMNDRIASLETTCHRLKCFVVGALLLLVGTTIAGFTQSRSLTTPPQPLRATSLDIVNDQGVIVVHLGARSSGAGGIWLTDAAGTRVLVINQDERGGKISIRNHQGAEAAAMKVNERGEGVLESE